MAEDLIFLERQLVFTISAVKIRRFVTMAVAEIREVPPRGHDELHLPNGAQDAREASAAGSTVFLPGGDCRGAAVFNNGKKFICGFSLCGRKIGRRGRGLIVVVVSSAVVPTTKLFSLRVTSAGRQGAEEEENFSMSPSSPSVM